MCSKNVIFAEFMHSYQDLEWFIPLVNYYRRIGVHVTVLLPVKECRNSQKMLAKWIREYADEVIYAVDLVYGKRISSIFKFGTCFYITNRVFNMFFLNHRKIFRVILKTISRMFVNLDHMDIYYIPSDVYGNRSGNMLLDVLCMHASINSKPIVGYVNKGIAVLDDKNNYNLNLGLSCLFTVRPFKHDKDDLSTVVMGAQRLSLNWYMEVNRYFSNTTDGNRLSMQLPSYRLVILLLLKTYTSPFADLIKYDDFILYRSKLIINLLELGFFLIIKPHPAQSEKELEAIDDLTVDNENDVVLTYLPVQFLASKASCTVMEMPSNSVLDCIATGAKAYWPYYDIMQMKQYDRGEYTKRLIKAGSPELFYRFVENKLPAKGDSFKLDPRVVDEFNELENIEIDIADSIKECEAEIGTDVL